MGQFLISGVLLAVTIFALVDVITRDSWRIKHLPKVMWVILIILLPLVGSIVWFVAGRDYERASEPVSFGDPRRHETLPVRASTTEQELAALEREIEFHENQERIRRLEAEVEARRGELRGE